jgi:O-antigen polymerase
MLARRIKIIARKNINNMLAHQKYATTYLYSVALLFLAAIHYFQGSDGGFGLFLAINNASWIAVAFIICIAVAQWEMTKKIKLSTTDLALLFVIVGLTIPFFWSQSPWRETAYGRYAAILAFWMLIVSTRQFTFTRSQQNIFWIIIVAGILIQCVVGVFQFFLADKVYFISGHRPAGTFLQVNVYASFIATGFAISLYQLCSQQLEKHFTIIHLLMIFCAGLLEMLIMSRVGMLGGAVVLVSFCFLFRQNRKQILAIIIIFILGVLSAVCLKTSHESSFRDTDNLTSTNGRAVIYKVSIELIKDAPLLGHGLGRFQSIYHEKQAEFLSLDSTIPLPSPSAHTHPHNELLFWWVEGGVIPVLSLLVFALWFSARVWRHGTINHKAAWLCCIPIVLHTQTEIPLYASVPHLALLGLLVAQATPDASKYYEASFRILPKILYGAFALVCVFMLTNLHTMRLMNQYVKTNEGNDLLAQIINPFAQRSMINYRQSIEFFRTKDPELLSIAAELMEYEIKVRPSDVAFWVLFNIQQALTLSESEQEKTADRAKYLFPRSQFFKDK